VFEVEGRDGVFLTKIKWIDVLLMVEVHMEMQDRLSKRPPDWSNVEASTVWPIVEHFNSGRDLGPL